MQSVISLSSRETEFYAAVRGACRTLGLATLMLDLGLSMKVELRTNTTAAKGLAWHDDEDVARCTACTPQPCGCDEQSHDGEIESRNRLDGFGMKSGIPTQKMWELLTRFGRHRRAGQADVAPQNVYSVLTKRIDT